MAERTALVIVNGQVQQLPAGDTLSGVGGDTELPKVTVGNGTDLITVDTTGIFWIAPSDGTITEWRIWTTDGNNATIEVDVLKNGTTIGEDIDLSASDTASGTGLSIAVSTGDELSFNIDANTDARKIIVQLQVEYS